MTEEFDKDGKKIPVDENTEKARQAAFEQICKRAILVNVTRKQLSNMPFDVSTTKVCAEQLNVKDASMLQVRKLLFLPERFSKIRSLINDALLMVWNHTRPWDNIGFRLLPMEYYDDFNETFGKIKDEFEEAVKEFMDSYDEALAESKKLLGKAFNKNDYPDKNQLHTYFQLEIRTAKFPDIDDIRLNLSGHELMQMRYEIEEKYEDTIKDNFNNLTKLIETNPKAPEAESFYKVAKSLNLNNDPEKEVRLSEIRELMGKEKEEEKEEEFDTEESMMVMDDIGNLDEIMDDYL